MSVAPPVNLPRVTRPRPTDATGLLWAFVSMVAGLFYAAIFPAFAIVLIACPLCLLWQFKKWRTDSSIVKAATNWCHLHYPNAGDTPVVDFMIALAHITHADLSECSPDTALDTLSCIWDDDQFQYWYPEAKNRTQAWLCEVFEEAKIEMIDPSAFSGSTLSDAIPFMQNVHGTV